MIKERAKYGSMGKMRKGSKTQTVETKQFLTPAQNYPRLESLNPYFQGQNTGAPDYKTKTRRVRTTYNLGKRPEIRATCVNYG